jgi:diguanylate cyclase (GGDEF)-like protein
VGKAVTAVAAPRALRIRGPAALVAAALAGYVAVYVSWTWLHWAGDRTVVSDLAPIPMAIAATVLAWVAGHDRHATVSRRRAWRWIAFGCASWSLAECLWFYFEVIEHRSPFPSPADVFYLTFYVLVFIGLVQLPVRDLGRKERVTFALDLATVMFVTLMVVWYLVIEPTVQTHNSLLTQALALAYPVGDVMLVLGVSRMMMRRRAGSEAPWPLALLAAGMTVLAVADIVYARLDLAGSYMPGTLPDALWIVALFAIALAGLTQWQSSWPNRPTVDDRDVAPPVSKLPYLAVLIGLLLVLNETSRNVGGPLSVLLLGALGLTLIVVARQVTVLRDNERLVRELHRLANTDPLTGLANRRRLFELAPRLVSRAHRSLQTVTAVMIDIDHFKEINDRYGHAAGDEVIRTVAERCSAALRPTDLLARYGGDEFIAIIAGETGSYRREIAVRLRESIGDECIETSAGPIETTLSVGVATSSEAGLERLLQEADAALLRAKRAGRNAVFRAPRVQRTTEPVAGGRP